MRDEGYTIAFFKALNGQASDVRALNLSNMQLRSNIGHVIEGIYNYTNLSELNLTSNDLPISSLGALAAFVKSRKSVKKFSMS